MHSCQHQSSSSERLPALDIVRGVAVLGIVAPNIIGMGQPLIAYGWPGGFLTAPGPWAEWLWRAQLVLVDGKFRGLFTLLFGAGMVLFLQRAVLRGRGTGLLARRLGWLGVFGFLHWALLWRGDILLAYAVAGLVVLGFTGWDWTRQLALGLTAYVVGALVNLAANAPLASAQHREAGGIAPELARALAAQMEDARVETALMRATDHGGRVAHVLGEHLGSLPIEIAFTLLETAPLMLIGMGLYGAGLFDGRIAARRQAAWGWGLWLLGTLSSIPIAAWVLTRDAGYWDSVAAFNGWLPLPQLLSALGLVALLGVWGQKPGGWLKQRLGDAGRCAFSNYIGVSVLALVVFSGAGLGLFGQLGRLELYGVMLGFWGLMLGWPALWLKRFRHGPLEWAWRCLTYWRWLPLRR